METTQVSRLRKNWKVCFEPIKFEKNMDQPTRAKQASASALWRQLRHQEFFQKLTNLSQNFSDNNHNNQIGRFLVLQEEEIERKKVKK